MYIERLFIRNFRCFEDEAVAFCTPRPTVSLKSKLIKLEKAQNINLILGANGSGKTTVLRAAAIAILGEVMTAGTFRPKHLISRRYGGEEAQTDVGVQLDLGPLEGHRTTHIRQRGDYQLLERPKEVDPGWEELYTDTSPTLFMVGFGSTRRVQSFANFNAEARTKDMGLRYARVASLFEDGFELTPFAAWLPDLRVDRPGLYEETRQLLDSLSPPGLRLSDQTEDGDLLWNHLGVDIPFSVLADGHRAYLGWISDLLYHATRVLPLNQTLASFPGIVLVDEIDLHLHAGLQLQLVDKLAGALPNMQFIVTSHSPLVAGTLPRTAIHYIRPIIEGSSSAEHRDRIVRPSVEMFGLSADQILTSDLFGLESTRAPAFVEELEVLAGRVNRGDRDAAAKYALALALGKGDLVAQDPPEWLLAASRHGKPKPV